MKKFVFFSMSLSAVLIFAGCAQQQKNISPSVNNSQPQAQVNQNTNQSGNAQVQQQNLNPVQKTLINIINTQANKAIDQLEQERMVARDKKRIADANLIITGAELYRLSFDKTPAFKDPKGNFRSLNLIKGSEDYNTLQVEINKIGGKGTTVPNDLLDPSRYYIYYSDGDKVTVTFYLENEQKGCKLIKPNYCELVYKNY